MRFYFVNLKGRSFTMRSRNTNWNAHIKPYSHSIGTQQWNSFWNADNPQSILLFKQQNSCTGITSCKHSFAFRQTSKDNVASVSCRLHSTWEGQCSVSSLSVRSIGEIDQSAHSIRLAWVFRAQILLGTSDQETVKNSTGIAKRMNQKARLPLLYFMTMLFDGF